MITLRPRYVFRDSCARVGRLAVATALAVIAGTSVTLASTVDDEWYKARAELFSDVCVKAAPKFSRFEKLALRKGFEPHEEPNQYLYEPEIVVSLSETQNACRCLMTMGAPDADRAAQELYQRIFLDYPRAYSEAASERSDHVILVRNGVEMELSLWAFENDGLPFFGGQIARKGGCSS